MNKKLIADLASIATELDVKGFTKEAKTTDNVLIKVAQMYDKNMPDEDWDKIEIEIKAGKEKAKQILNVMYGGKLYDSLCQLELDFREAQGKLYSIKGTADDYLYDHLDEFFSEVKNYLQQMSNFRSFIETKFGY
jgi:hypothetical protein